MPEVNQRLLSEGSNFFGIVRDLLEFDVKKRTVVGSVIKDPFFKQFENTPLDKVARMSANALRVHFEKAG
jgi:hypothetical protein